MTARRVRPADVARWIELRTQLWPDQAPGELAAEARAALDAKPPLRVWVAEGEDGLVGFLELSLRSYAEGCSSSPTPYVEGWYVAPGYRRRGLGAALMAAAIAWCREHGYTELGSDALATNRLSRHAHRALGFDEVATLVVFRKALWDGRGAPDLGADRAH